MNVKNIIMIVNADLLKEWMNDKSHWLPLLILFNLVLFLVISSDFNEGCLLHSRPFIISVSVIVG